MRKISPINMYKNTNKNLKVEISTKVYENRDFILLLNPFFFWNELQQTCCMPT